MAPFDLAKADFPSGTPVVDIVKARIAKGHFSPDGPKAYLEEKLRVAALMLVDDTEYLGELHDGRYIQLISHRLAAGGCVVTSEDVTELKRNQARISYLAEHDALTGLANRAQFALAMEQAVARLNSDGTPFSVLMLDLDRFKSINDTLGHAAGDALLKEVATRLRNSTRSTDAVARLGGDEFAIIQSRLRDGSTEAAFDPQRDAIDLAERILQVIGEPIEIGGKKVFAGTSIGLASAPADGADPGELLSRADFALYQSKSAGRNSYRVFDSQMMASTREREALEREMRAGMERGEFILHYQPIVDARTRAVSAVEAVMVWNHPQKGVLPASRFIDIADGTGLIVPLGERLIRRACVDAADWPERISVTLNVSAVQFRKGDLLAVVRSALAASGLSPRRLEVEVTESALHQDDGRFIATLQQLREMGVLVALDHFGTGYSSFSELTKSQFDKIKIDGAFTRAVAESVQGMMIVSSVCSLARGLGMYSIADEVETDDQMEVLRAAGISYAQGSLFGAPRPAEELDLGESLPTTARISA
jgi:diguanylate cyclase (GGDEF)-like protein